MLVIKPPPTVTIRWMISRDAEEVLAIERASFALPWSEADFADQITVPGCIPTVAEEGDGERGWRVVGYALYEMHRRRLDLVRLAVLPSWRRRGVGSLLIARMIGKLSDRRRRKIRADVPERLVEGQVFLRANGFQVVDILRERFGSEDGYRMEYRTGRDS